MADFSHLSPATAALLQHLQQRFPNAVVTSGYRDPAYNARVGGAKGSQHMHGNALDFSTRGLDDATKAALVQEAIASGARGIGIYPGGSLHFDTRSSPAFWGTGGSYRGQPIASAPAWAQSSLAGLFGGGGGGNVTASHAAPSGGGGGTTSVASAAPVGETSGGVGVTPVPGAEAAMAAYEPPTSSPTNLLSSLLAGAAAPAQRGAPTAVPLTQQPEADPVLPPVQYRSAKLPEEMIAAGSLTPEIDPAQSLAGLFKLKDIGGRRAAPDPRLVA